MGMPIWPNWVFYLYICLQQHVFLLQNLMVYLPTFWRNLSLPCPSIFQPRKENFGPWLFYSTPCTCSWKHFLNIWCMTGSQGWWKGECEGARYLLIWLHFTFAMRSLDSKIILAILTVWGTTWIHMNASFFKNNIFAGTLFLT